MVKAEWLESVLAIYGDSYAEVYPSLYLDPWPKKHRVNVANLGRILDELQERCPSLPRWLDLACGQAWHFSWFPGRAQMRGIDLSEAQLVRARVNAPAAQFSCQDMTEARFPEASFDLITNFWAGYCYLNSRERISTLFRSAVEWIAPGGALYVEVLLGEDVVRFNRSGYADHFGFSASPRTGDYVDWDYDDSGGKHILTSPPLQDFLDIVSPAFSAVETRHDGTFMVHLIATGRK